MIEPRRGGEGRTHKLVFVVQERHDLAARRYKVIAKTLAPPSLEATMEVAMIAA